ncbi:MAG: type II secretion system ATPase GspE [Armatimonadota bacterium]
MDLFTGAPSLHQALVASGLLSADALAAALAEQRTSGKRLVEVLLSRGLVAERPLMQALAEMLGLELVSLAGEEVPSAVLGKVPSELALSRQVLPVSADVTTLTVAVADPLDLATQDDLQMLTGLAIRPVLATPSEIRRATERFYMARMLQDAEADETQEGRGGDEALDVADLQKMAQEELIIQLVNLLINQAIQDRASDIHIEPFERELRVRYRIDGILHEASSPPKRLHPAIVSRIKILSDMDIAERRLPQDGRMRIQSAGRQIDLRVSTVPSLYGESVVMRILDRSAAVLSLEEIGMRSDALSRFRSLIRSPHGIILVTGPTGSGKTTTLYSGLTEIYSEERKIITIEDPVEYRLHGITQIQVHPQIGLTFAGGLRSIVRQDPDVIMVGEIRDGETADIAIHAALTGHLVLSTLHTNDAAGAVSRLLDMGAEPFLVASSLIGSLAQRLVRVICPACRVPVPEGHEMWSQAALFGGELARGPLYYGPGCVECRGLGYRGRTGIFELLPVDEEVHQMIMRHASAGEIRAHAMRHGMTTLLGDARRKVLAGETPVSELLRVCQRESDSD